VLEQLADRNPRAEEGAAPAPPFQRKLTWSMGFGSGRLTDSGPRREGPSSPEAASSSSQALRIGRLKDIQTDWIAQVRGNCREMQCNCH
jgi:hypothetical protein